MMTAAQQYPPREWRWLDKAGWGEGPWADEPDKVQWVDEATGLDCLAVRNENFGSWCGYVGVSEHHPAFGKGYDDVDEYDSDAGAQAISVHGGLTFAGLCMEPREGEPNHGICHVAYPGRPDKVWWLGFDCAHAFDAMPASAARWGKVTLAASGRPDTYRTLDYVREECRALAGQLAAMPPERERAVLDGGGASRFYYVAKASRAERNAGLPPGMVNDHPCVKPIALMRWLVRLVTPRDGLVVDPFAGSGTTGIACVLEGFRFLGIEQDERHAAVARRRIAHWADVAGRRQPALEGI
jgi:hypothetical protein